MSSGLCDSLELVVVLESSPFKKERNRAKGLPARRVVEGREGRIGFAKGRSRSQESLSVKDAEGVMRI